MRRMLIALLACCLTAAWAGDDEREGSVYDLGSAWTDSHGRGVSLADLGGKPEVVAMFFSHCTFACPRITADMKRIESALAEEQRARAGFVMVSFDVARDTPEALADFADTMQINRPGWLLLHGDEEETRDLAAVLGVRYRKEGEDFAHSNLITLLDAKGHIVYQREGLDTNLDEIVAKLKALL